MGLLNVRLSGLETTCTGLALLTGLSASLTAMMVALAALIATSIVASVKLCSAAIFAMLFLKLPCVSLALSSIF